SFRPNARAQANIAWNPARRTLVMSGGLGGALDLMDSYEWNGTAWRPIVVTNPPIARGDFGAAASIDGAGVMIYGGTSPRTRSSVRKDRWVLRWDSGAASDRCDGTDVDGDGLVRCADPDCWWACTPLCPPGTTCDPAAPKCGDNICQGGPET